MAKLVYIAHGLRSGLYNSLALCRRLVAAGHDVEFWSFRDVGTDVAASGMEFRLLADGPRAHDEFAASVAAVGRVRSVPLGRSLRRQLIESTEVCDELGRAAPDLVLVDAEVHGAIVAVRALGLPTVLVDPFFSVWRDVAAPPLHTDLGPDPALRSRLHRAALWSRLLVARRAGRMAGRLDPRSWPSHVMPFHLNNPRLANIRAVAGTNGVELDDLVSRAHWLHPHVYPGVPMISTTVAELDFATRVPTWFSYVGPMIDPSRPEPLVSEADQAQWLHFAEASARRGQRIVYVAMGSMQRSDPSFYRAVLGAVRSDERLALVVGLGAQARPADMGALPANVCALGYAPQFEILQRASVAVYPGGVGTLFECVMAQTPTVVVSTGLVDQPGNAARTDYFGLGRRLAHHDLSESAVAAAIGNVVSNSAIATNLQRYRDVVKGYQTRQVVESVVARTLTGAARLREAP